MGDKIRLKAYAKINLLLDVVGKYENNYHKVKMVMQTIDLYDKLIFSKTEQNINISCKHPGVPLGKKNLILQAADLLFSEFELEGGLDVKVKKNIPVAAGMAGGSTDAAATLVAINKLWGLGLSTSELESRAANLGADVPFCIAGGTQLATGTGTELEKIDVQPNLNLVVINPALEVSTAEIYSCFSLSEIEQHPNLDKLILALKNNDYKFILSNLANLLELVTMNRYPKIREVKDIVAENTDKALMSGSGPTILGFTNSRQEAKQTVSELKQKLNSNYKIMTANSIDSGIDLI